LEGPYSETLFLWAQEGEAQTGGLQPLPGRQSHSAAQGDHITSPTSATGISRSASFREAVVLSRHMAAGRVPDAKLAHKVVAAEVQRVLQGYGIVDEGYVELLNQLVSFLDVAGLRYHDGKWAIDPRRA
jgi:hypothetical protein